MVFGKNGFNEVSGDATLMIGSGITIRGSGGTFNANTLINLGTVDDDDSGGVSGAFVNDTGSSGGGTASTADVIDLSGVTSPAPEAVYQTYRTGLSPFSYTLSGLTGGRSYTVRLHFADPTSTAAGQREFNVSINGTDVLTDFDIVATAGGMDKAVVESFTATANGQGQISVVFSSGAVGVPLISGIEVDSGSAIVQAIDCGELPGIGLSISGTITNSGSLAVSNGQNLTVDELTGDLGAATLSGPGSSLTVYGPGYVVDQGIAASAGETVSLNYAWSNAAGSTISGNGATLDLGSDGDTWYNLGTISATNSNVVLSGAFTPGGLGTFDRSGGTVVVKGFLYLTDTPLALDASTGSWIVDGGLIADGQYSASGGAELQFTSNGDGNILDGLTANSDLDFASTNGASATILGGLTLNNATIAIGNASGSNAGRVIFGGTETLDGTGTVLFGNDGNVNDLEANGTLTIGSGITVRGTGGLIDGEAIINTGVVAADASGGGGGGTLTIDPSISFTNQGTMRATNNDAIVVTNLAANEGVISAGAGSTVTVNGAFVQDSSGTLAFSVGGTAQGKYGKLAATGCRHARRHAAGHARGGLHSHGR